MFKKFSSLLIRNEMHGKDNLLETKLITEFDSHAYRMGIPKNKSNILKKNTHSIIISMIRERF